MQVLGTHCLYFNLNLLGGNVSESWIWQLCGVPKKLCNPSNVLTKLNKLEHLKIAKPISGEASTKSQAEECLSQSQLYLKQQNHRSEPLWPWKGLKGSRRM